MFGSKNHDDRRDRLIEELKERIIRLEEANRGMHDISITMAEMVKALEKLRNSFEQHVESDIRQFEEINTSLKLLIESDKKLDDEVRELCLLFKTDLESRKAAVEMKKIQNDRMWRLIRWSTSVIFFVVPAMFFLIKGLILAGII